MQLMVLPASLCVSGCRSVEEVLSSSQQELVVVTVVLCPDLHSPEGIGLRVAVNRALQRRVGAWGWPGKLLLWELPLWVEATSREKGLGWGIKKSCFMPLPP